MTAEIPFIFADAKGGAGAFDAWCRQYAEPDIRTSDRSGMGYGEQGKVARSATPKPVVDPCTTRSAIKVSTPWAECERVGPAQLEADPMTRSMRYVPTTCRMPNRRRPARRGLAAVARRVGLDPGAVREERKTSLARVNAVSSLVDRQFVLLCVAGTRQRHGEPWYI